MAVTLSFYLHHLSLLTLIILPLLICSPFHSLPTILMFQVTFKFCLRNQPPPSSSSDFLPRSVRRPSVSDNGNWFCVCAGSVLRPGLRLSAGQCQWIHYILQAPSSCLLFFFSSFLALSLSLSLTRKAIKHIRASDCAVQCAVGGRGATGNKSANTEHIHTHN